MLDKLPGHHQGAGGQAGGAAGDAGVQNQIHAVFQAENLCRHGGVYLADAAHTGGQPLAQVVKGHAGHRLKRLQLPRAGHGPELHGHGELQSDLHGNPPILSPAAVCRTWRSTQSPPRIWRRSRDRSETRRRAAQDHPERGGPGGPAPRRPR